MTTAHPGNPTTPMRPGAPLPESMDELPTLRTPDIQQELARAEVELLYALARHRKAWKAMRTRMEERDALVDQPGGLAAIDSDPIWKKRTGDVSWWRDEITAQATAVQALRAMLLARTIPEVRPGLAHTPGSREKPPSVRHVVYSWDRDGGQTPSREQVQAARIWADMVGGVKHLTVEHREQVTALLAASERAGNIQNPRVS